MDQRHRQPRFRFHRLRNRRTALPGPATAAKTGSRPGRTIRSPIRRAKRSICATRRQPKCGHPPRCRVARRRRTWFDMAPAISIFEHHSHGLAQRLRLFAAPEAPVKVVQLRLENLWRIHDVSPPRSTRNGCLGVTRDTAPQYVVSEYDGEHQALLARNRLTTPSFGERVAFVAASRPLHGLTADRTEFLGRAGRPVRSPPRWIGLAWPVGSSRVSTPVPPCKSISICSRVRCERCSS